YLSMDINNIFAKRLRELRKSKGLTQEKLAEVSDIDYKYLQKLESSNPSSPTLSVIEKLSRGLGITLTEFIKFIEEGRE
ncbi:MAG: helix-turn-helix transcriptional regulator, partial [Mucispirillum sp.]|nr:helix-turn-helix transcriptional regulator [Mucispirillum sp.]